MSGEAEESGGHENNIGNVDELPWKITNTGDLETAVTFISWCRLAASLT